jgi:hypothetical protein
MFFMLLGEFSDYYDAMAVFQPTAAPTFVLSFLVLMTMVRD